MIILAHISAGQLGVSWSKLVSIRHNSNFQVGSGSVPYVYHHGSGFFISNDGKIATNYHVIKGAYTVKATLYTDNSTHSVINVLGYNIAQDVAIIQIDLEIR